MCGSGWHACHALWPFCLVLHTTHTQHGSGKAGKRKAAQTSHRCLCLWQANIPPLPPTLPESAWHAPSGGGYCLPTTDYTTTPTPGYPHLPETWQARQAGKSPVPGRQGRGMPCPSLLSGEGRQWNSCLACLLYNSDKKEEGGGAGLHNTPQQHTPWSVCLCMFILYVSCVLCL